jgi:hypothetical protein
MANAYDRLGKKTKGAWVVHHGHKVASMMGAGAQFPALEAAGKAASLLSQFAASNQNQLDKKRVDALATAAGLNPRMELPTLLEMLKRRRVIDVATSGDVEVIGLTTVATVQHASDLFESENPSVEEKASIALADLTSQAPTGVAPTREFISDEFGLVPSRTSDLLNVSESIGFVDAEGKNNDKLLFNGNLFRRDGLTKVKRVLESLSAADAAKVSTLDAELDARGCLSIDRAEQVLGVPLFDKLKAAGSMTLITLPILLANSDL